MISKLQPLQESVMQSKTWTMRSIHGSIQRLSARDDDGDCGYSRDDSTQLNAFTLLDALKIGDALGYLLYAKHNPAIMGSIKPQRLNGRYRLEVGRQSLHGRLTRRQFLFTFNLSNLHLLNESRSSRDNCTFCIFTQLKTSPTCIRLVPR